MIKRLVSRLMISSLKKGLRRICWIGPVPAFPADLPVVAYSNHHTFYDGYVLWLLAQKMLHREAMLWMEEWHHFPFFAAVGAYPFPADDPARRLKTVRQTARKLRQNPQSLLIYFPEGKLHAPESGILPIESKNLEKLNRILPDKIWWPVSIHMTTWGEDRPTLLLSGGTPHRSINGDEAENLEKGLKFLRSTKHRCSQLLLEGAKSKEEAWNMAWLGKWFERYL